MKAKLIPAFLVFCCIAPAAFADQISFLTHTGSVDTAGETVAALATITTGAGTVTIDLSNTLTASQVQSVGQDLSALSFSLVGVSAAGTVSSSNGTFISIASGGSVSSATGPHSGPNFIGWGLSNAGSVYTLNDLVGGASPAGTIIGGAGATAYSSGNASIDNGSHDPFVQGMGVWVLSIPGVTSTTDIKNVYFSFGTTPGDTVPAPEPSTVLLLVIGLGALLAVVTFRRKYVLIQQ